MEKVVDINTYKIKKEYQAYYGQHLTSQAIPTKYVPQRVKLSLVK